MKITKELLDKEWLESQLELENQKKFEEEDRKRKEREFELFISNKVDRMLDNELGQAIRTLNKQGYRKAVFGKTGTYKECDSLSGPTPFGNGTYFSGPILGFDPDPEKGYTKILLLHIKNAGLNATIEKSINGQMHYLIIDWS
ncbi:hypothetical protein C4577_04870 [Candidatus Parcubacteria bacterium]|nr:MAG: hypothetical protein C4577_04870 [Candidatus Parcubacteria bacterium]